jgi:hypothetical protein
MNDTANMHHDDRHVQHLEKKIDALTGQLAALGNAQHLKELLLIIHRPGWTTIAEVAFVNAILDNIGAQVHTLDRLQAELVAASRKVA